MLHSTLPRAFLSPGINYLSYYGEEVLHQCPTSNWHIPIEDSPSAYSRITERENLQSWQSSRSSTPCPLDLSLKSSASVCVTKTEEPGQLIQAKDSNAQAEAPRQLDARVYRIPENDHGSVRTNELEGPSRNCPVHDFQNYDHGLSRKDSIHLQGVLNKTHLPEEIINVPTYTAKEITSKYHVENPKFLAESTNALEPTTQGYHRQLFLTPQHHLHDVHAPMTPPSTPSPPHCPRRRVREEDAISQSSSVVATTPKQTDKSLQKSRKKHARRLKFDEDTSSPVSGTVILGPDEAVVTGDIDPAFNIVEVTEEARAELAKIENRLGPYQCKLCRQLHEDAFQLAQHRCSRIAHVEYRCPECDKRFSCPANLASHRRWHKPKLTNGENSTSGSSTEIPCTRCEAKFPRQAALRKHLANQHSEDNNNDVLSFESQENISKADGNQLMSNGSPTNEMT